MKHYLEQVVGKTISSVKTGIAQIRATVGGTIGKVTVYVPEDVGATLTFDINKNGASIFASPGDRPSITSGNDSDSADGLAVAVSAGDKLTVDADAVGEAFQYATVVIEIEDGQSAGSAGGGHFSIDGKPSSDMHPLSDYFDGELSFSTFQSDYQNSFIEGGRMRMILPSEADERSTGQYKPLPAGDCTIIAKIWNPATEVDFANIGLCLFQDAAGNPNTSKYISARLEKTTGHFKAAVAYYTDYHTPSAYIGSLTTDLSEDDFVPVYLKFVRSVTTWTAYYSQRGRFWTQLGDFFSEGSYFTPNSFGIVAINNTHGNTNFFDVEFVYFYDSAVAKLPGGNGTVIESAVTQRIIFLGDSITQGIGVSALDSFPNHLANSLDAVSVGFDGTVLQSDDGAREWKIINKGVDGYTTQNIIDRLLPNTILRRDPDLTRDLVVVFAGTNDIAALGSTAAAIYGRLTTIVTDLQAEGFEVAVCTTIDRNGSIGFDAVRASLNTLISANTAGADFVIDLYADSRLQNAANSTYFQVDEIHPNAAGMAVIADLIEALL